MPVMMMMMMQVTRSAMPTLFLGSGLALAEDIAKASEQDWNSAMASRGRKPPRREQQQQQQQQQQPQAQASPQLQQQPAEAQADDDGNVTTPIKGGTVTTPSGNGIGNANPAEASSWDATAAPSPKPFFIMDWLDDLTADHDLTQIARLLQTPAKKKKTMRWKLRQDGRDDYGGDDEDDDVDDDDDDDVCSVASPTSPMLFDQDADPTTPKSSNRRNKHSLLSTSVSCPSFRTRPPTPPQPPSSTHITSPLRPKQLLFGRWSSPATRHGGHGHDHNNHESNQEAGATTTTSSTYISGPESALPLPLQRRSISASHADLDSGTRGTSSDLLTPPRSTDRAMLRPRRRRRRSPRSPQTMYRKSVRLGNAWNTKGLQKAQLGAWQDALACWDNALEIRQHLLGGRHVDVAHTCNNRGIALGQLGCFGEAFEALEQALNIHQHHLDQLAQLQQPQQQEQPNDDEGQVEDNECTGQSTEGECSKSPTPPPYGHAHSTTPPAAGGGASTTASRITGIGSRIKSHQGAMISTLHNMANVHQQAEQLDQALRVLVLARDLAQDHFQQDREQEQQRLLLRPQGSHGSPDDVDHESLPPVMSSSSSSLIPIARLCVAIGHIYVQVEQWTDARDAYQDAIVWYRHERERQRYLLSLCQQQQQTQQRQDRDRDDLISDMAMTTDDNETYQEDALSAALLSCQQELLDVERDLSHILAHHNVELHPQDRQQQQQQQLMTKKGENRQDVVCGFPTSRHR